VAVPVPLSAQDPAVLEQRIRRLEDTLARLLAQPNANPVMAVPASSSATGSSAGSPIVSAAAVAGVVSSVGQLLSGEKPGSETTAAVRAAVRRNWWLTEQIAEVRAIYRMYVDPRYRMSWVGRVVPGVLLAVFILSRWGFLPSVPLVGWLLQTPFEIIVIYALCKVLGYEARRYREKAPDLPASLRL
jgi:hypothetical protein